MRTKQSAWRDVPSWLPIKNFAYPLPKPGIRTFPTLGPQRAEKGNDFHVYADGGTRSADGETLAGWAAVARSPDGRIYVMFGPVITTEAHLANEGARIHSNNTAELWSIVEALSLPGPLGPAVRGSHSCIFLIPSTLQVSAWARSKHG